MVCEQTVFTPIETLAKQAAALIDSTNSPGKTALRRRRKSITKKVRINQPLYLKHSWTLWYDESTSLNGSSDSFQKIGTFNSVQGFWQYYNNLVDPSKFPQPSNLRLFKEGITPSFDCAPNVNGGKWTIPCNRSETGAAWIQIVLSLIGEQFSSSCALSGIVLSVRNPILDNIFLVSSSQVDTDEVTAQLRKLIPSVHNITYRSSIEHQYSTSNLKRNFNSSCNLTKIESSNTGITHKKSSSFSNSQFSNLNSPSCKRHRKTQSDSQQKKSSLSRTPQTSERKSVSFSDVPPRNSSTIDSETTNSIINTTAIQQTQQITVPQQRSGVSFAHLLALFLLVILLVSGYLLTPSS